MPETALRSRGLMYMERTGITRFTVRDAFYLYCAIFAFLVLVFSPYYLIDFVHTDDANLFDPKFWSSSLADEITSGRVLFNLILRATVFPIIRAHHSIAVLPYFRIATTAVLAAAGTVVAVQLRQLRLPALTAFCIVVLIFVLPGVQQYVEHINEFVMAIGIVLAIAGGMFLASLGKRILHPPSMSLRDWLFLLASLLLLLLSCNSYQGSAMCFMLPIVSRLLFSADGMYERLTLAVAQLVIFCAGLMLYFLSNKFVLIPLGAALVPAVRDPAQGFYHFDLAGNLFDKLTRAIRVLLPVAARLWWFQSSGAQYVAIGAMAVGSLALTVRCYFNPKKQSRLFCLEPLLLLILVFGAAILANSPSIMSFGSGLFFRLLFPSSALFVLFICWILMRLLQGTKRIFRFVLIAAVIVVGISAHLTVHASAINANVEVTILREAIGQLILTKQAVKELAIIRPPSSPPYVGADSVSPDEFNAPSTSDLGFAYEMVQLLAQETDTNWAETNLLRVTPMFDAAYLSGDLDTLDPVARAAVCKNDVMYLHEGAVIADMAAPLYLAPRFIKSNRGSCPREFAYYDVFPESFIWHSSLRLFDSQKSDDRYWQTQPYPVVFRVRYEEPKVITGYTLGAAKLPTGMPASWQFEASSDTVTWITLDEQRGQVGWSPHEERTFPVAHPDRYKYYRLVFTKGLEDTLCISTIRLSIGSTPRPESGGLDFPFSYDGYNIVHVGELYVGIAHELGRVDPEAILKSAQPHPSPCQFMVAHDLATLQRAIRAAEEGCPMFLFTYSFYNVVRVGTLYVGVSRSLGSIKVDAVLAQIVPRPPLDKFLVADNIPSLETQIDATHPVRTYIRWHVDRLIHRWALSFTTQR